MQPIKMYLFAGGVIEYCVYILIQAGAFICVRQSNEFGIDFEKNNFSVQMLHFWMLILSIYGLHRNLNIFFVVELKWLELMSSHTSAER